ncbi:hypothetical protein [Paenibacillus sp. TC-CSREp1]|uniref:hypothetical protein n=1 Tax=Paenibacillus sp. TC-CSREp1 TaxID=3410089 RepID=UPI003CF84BB1
MARRQGDTSGECREVGHVKGAGKTGSRRSASKAGSIRHVAVQAENAGKWGM